MDTKQIELVQDTFKQVSPISEQAAELFYGRLFEIDPTAKPLFERTDMKEQGRKLMQMIGIAVNGLDRLDEIAPAVADLGRRHVGYGVEEKHYDTVGAALLWALGQGLGEAFTPAVKDAWTEAYGVLAKVMTEAAAEGR